MISFEEWITAFETEGRFAYCRKGDVPPAGKIVIWEDQWQFRQEIVKSRVLSKLGLLERIPGRLCNVQRISRPVADQFLEMNHLQGATASKIKYGLFLPQKYFRVLKEKPPGTDIDFSAHISERSKVLEEKPPGTDIDFSAHISKKGKILKEESSGGDMLMAVMTFSGPRSFHDGTRSYELIRFAVRCNFHVQGGFSRLLQYFIREKDPDSIMTYVDLDWYSGSTYEALGFEPAGVLPPIRYRVDENGKRWPALGVLALGKPLSGEKSSGTTASGESTSRLSEEGREYDVINKGSLKMIWKKKS